MRDQTLINDSVLTIGIGKSSGKTGRCYHCLRYYHKFLTLSIVLFIISVVPSEAYPESDKYSLVVYPPHLAEQRTVFLDEILRGIASTNRRFNLKTFAVDVNDPNLSKLINDERLINAISIGNTFFRTRSLNRNVKHVFCASFPSTVLQEIDDHSGILFTPDPAYVFQKLVQTLGSWKRRTIKRVHVVYSDAISHWVITQADVAASEVGLELAKHPVSTVSEAGTTYSTLIPSLSPHDSLWLINDPFSNNDTFIELIVRLAWIHQIPIISNKLSDVEAGVLFAVYPNLEATGNRLAELALGEKQQIITITELSAAINKRVAVHLGVPIDAVNDEFSLTYPSHITE